MLQMSQGVRRARAALIMAALWSSMATAGTTHEPGVIPLAVLPYIFGISVDQSDPNYLFLATRGGVYRMAPDGASVRVSASKSAFSNVVSHPSFASVLYAVGPPEVGLNPILITSSNSGVGLVGRDIE